MKSLVFVGFLWCLESLRSGALEFLGSLGSIESLGPGEGVHEVLGVFRIPGSVGSPGVSGLPKIPRTQFLHIWIISYNMKFPARPGGECFAPPSLHKRELPKFDSVQEQVSVEVWSRILQFVAKSISYCSGSIRIESYVENNVDRCIQMLFSLIFANLKNRYTSRFRSVVVWMLINFVQHNIIYVIKLHC